MCDDCRQYICPPGCPNFTPKRIYDCTACSEPICEGDKYIDLGGPKYHLDCFEDMSPEEQGKLLGFDVLTASDDY